MVPPPRLALALAAAAALFTLASSAHAQRAALGWLPAPQLCSNPWCDPTLDNPSVCDGQCGETVVGDCSCASTCGTADELECCPGFQHTCQMCNGNCSGPAANADCACDPDCTWRGDCCPGHTLHCAVGATLGDCSDEDSAVPGAPYRMKYEAPYWQTLNRHYVAPMKATEEGLRPINEITDKLVIPGGSEGGFEYPPAPYNGSDADDPDDPYWEPLPPPTWEEWSGELADLDDGLGSFALNTATATSELHAVCELLAHRLGGCFDASASSHDRVVATAIARHGCLRTFQSVDATVLSNARSCLDSSCNAIHECLDFQSCGLFQTITQHLPDVDAQAPELEALCGVDITPASCTTACRNATACTRSSRDLDACEAACAALDGVLDPAVMADWQSCMAAGCDPGAPLSDRVDTCIAELWPAADTIPQACTELAERMTACNHDAEDVQLTRDKCAALYDVAAATAQADIGTCATATCSDVGACLRTASCGLSQWVLPSQWQADPGTDPCVHTDTFTTDCATVCTRQLGVRDADHLTACRARCAGLDGLLGPSTVRRWVTALQQSGHSNPPSSLDLMDFETHLDTAIVQTVAHPTNLTLTPPLLSTGIPQHVLDLADEAYNPDPPVIGTYTKRARPGAAIILHGSGFWGISNVGPDPVTLSAPTPAIVWVAPVDNGVGAHGVFQAATLDQYDHTIVARLPEHLPPTLYLVWVETTEGISSPVRINAPEVWNINRTFVRPSETLYLYGRELVPDGAEGTRRAAIAIRPWGSQAAFCVGASPEAGCQGSVRFVYPENANRLQFNVPDLLPYDHEVWVHSGYGGPFGWSGPLRIRAQPEAPFAVDSVCSAFLAAGDADVCQQTPIPPHMGCPDDDVDDTQAFRHAIECLNDQVTAGTNPRFRLDIPAGEFLISETIDVPVAIHLAGIPSTSSGPLEPLTKITMRLTCSPGGCQDTVLTSAQKFNLSDGTVAGIALRRFPSQITDIAFANDSPIQDFLDLATETESGEVVSANPPAIVAARGCSGGCDGAEPDDVRRGLEITRCTFQSHLQGTPSLSCMDTGVPGSHFHAIQMARVAQVQIYDNDFLMPGIRGDIGLNHVHIHHNRFYPNIRESMQEAPNAIQMDSSVNLDISHNQFFNQSDLVLACGLPGDSVTLNRMISVASNFAGSRRVYIAHNEGFDIGHEWTNNGEAILVEGANALRHNHFVTREKMASVDHNWQAQSDLFEETGLQPNQKITLWRFSGMANEVGHSGTYENAECTDASRVPTTTPCPACVQLVAMSGPATGQVRVAIGQTLTTSGAPDALEALNASAVSIRCDPDPEKEKLCHADTACVAGLCQCQTDTECQQGIAGFDTPEFTCDNGLCLPPRWTRWEFSPERPWDVSPEPMQAVDLGSGDAEEGEPTPFAVTGTRFVATSGAQRVVVRDNVINGLLTKDPDMARATVLGGACSANDGISFSDTVIDSVIEGNRLEGFCRGIVVRGLGHQGDGVLPREDTVHGELPARCKGTESNVFDSCFNPHFGVALNTQILKNRLHNNGTGILAVGQPSQQKPSGFRPTSPLSGQAAGVGFALGEIYDPLFAERPKDPLTLDTIVRDNVVTNSIAASLVVGSRGGSDAQPPRAIHTVVDHNRMGGLLGGQFGLQNPPLGGTVDYAQRLDWACPDLQDALGASGCCPAAATAGDLYKCFNMAIPSYYGEAVAHQFNYSNGFHVHLAGGQASTVLVDNQLGLGQSSGWPDVEESLAQDAGWDSGVYWRRRLSMPMTGGLLHEFDLAFSNAGPTGSNHDESAGFFWDGTPLGRDYKLIDSHRADQMAVSIDGNPYPDTPAPALADLVSAVPAMMALAPTKNAGDTVQTELALVLAGSVVLTLQDVPPGLNASLWVDDQPVEQALLDVAGQSTAVLRVDVQDFCTTVAAFPDLSGWAPTAIPLVLSAQDGTCDGCGDGATLVVWVSGTAMAVDPACD